jgi:hypothetical protein
MHIISNNCFYDTICLLRSNEEILLHTKIMDISEREEKLLLQFLENEYQKECPNYPFMAPSFDKNAALWAAKIIYFASQLLLYRENKTEELNSILPAYPNAITPSSILSVDICLRFLPSVILNAKNIDADDAIVPILENHLQTWHYSGIGYDLDKEKMAFNVIFADDCLKQLYINRIIEKKCKSLTELPILKSEILASLGNYKNYFWKEL